MSAAGGDPVAAHVPPPSWPMLRAMVSVGLLCGLLITTAYIATRPAIERNRAEALQRAIFEVLPAARSARTFAWVEDRGFERVRVEEGEKTAAPVVHVGLDEAGGVAGVAIEAAGMGYQDVIRVLYGYSPERTAVIGMVVLESRETPGLGDRIETDPAFRANFERLDVALEPGGERIAHPIEAVKHGEKEAPWQIDGITGATISSNAIALILQESTAVWIPRIHSRLAQLEGGD